MATSEGVSELTGRVAGAAFFEFSKCFDAYSNPDAYTQKERSNAYGKCTSVLLNFTI